MQKEHGKAKGEFLQVTVKNKTGMLQVGVSALKT